MDLQHVTVKLYADRGGDLDTARLVPIFHRWIQQVALKGVMMIDVAEYSHVPRGPGVMLICHEGQFALDDSDGRRGVQYANKRLATGSVRDRIATALHRAASAARLLEAEESLDLGFATDELLVRIDDFLHAPNTDEAFESIRGDVQAALADAYGGPVELERVDDPKTGLTIRATAETPVDLATLIERTAAARQAAR